MSSYEEASAAKEKFKELYWKKSPDRFNIIGVGTESFFSIVMDETDQLDDLEISETDIVDHFYVRVYLFDINDIVALELPNSIDNVEIRYIPVITDI